MRTKPYLVTATIQDGNHEHRAYAIIFGNNEADAHKRAYKTAPTDCCGLDNRNSKWGWGDNTTATRIRSIKPLTKEQNEVLQTLGVAHAL